MTDVEDMANIKNVLVQTMDQFIKSVVEIPLRAEVLAAVPAAIVGARFDHADHLADTPTSQIDKLADSVQGPASGLVARAFSDEY